MRSFLAFPILIAATLGVLIAAAAHAAPAAPVVEIVGAIDNDTVKVVDDALDRVKPGDPVTVYIDSRGGSVPAGLRVIEILRRSGAKTTCEVGSAAMSMAAVILESPACGTRVVRPWSVIMFHRVSTAVDRADLEQLTQSARSVYAMDRALAALVAPRLGLTEAEYFQLVTGEWWLIGSDAVRTRAADKETP